MVFYALAAYYYLAIPNWSFLTAFLVALPLILIEYHFSLRGNHIMYDRIQWNATQVAVVSLVFYFINTWIMNKFIFKRKFVLWREIVGFFVIGGCICSDSMGRVINNDAVFKKIWAIRWSILLV